MIEMNFEEARFNMVNQQIRPWNLLDDRVLEQMQQIPREEFVPPRYRQMAFSDIEIPLGHDQIILSPKIEAQILQAVNIQSTDNVLEIGTGSGFLTAVISHLASKVTTIEYYEDFLEQARQKHHDMGLNNIRYIEADALGQIDFHDTYDVIIISGASSEIPSRYRNLLRINGRMFVMCGDKTLQQAHLLTKVDEVHCADEVLFESRIPFLISAEKKPPFSF